MTVKDRFEPDEMNAGENAACSFGLHNGDRRSDRDAKARRADRSERVHRGSAFARVQHAQNDRGGK